MKKKIKKIIFWSILISVIVILLLSLIGIIVVGGKAGWFKFIINVPSQNISLTPNPQTPTYNSCSQVCSNQGYSKYYTFIDSCKAGESKVTYGYPNQASTLICCCYNIVTPPTPTCTETDTGLDYNVFGTCESSVTKTGIADECSNVITLKEAFCDYTDYKCKYTYYNCPDGWHCNGGKCVQTIECVDTDSTIVPFEEQLQTTSYCYDKIGSYTDHCFEGTDSLIEYYCEPVMAPQSEKTCGSVSYNCPGMILGSHCEHGACVY
jgi:hypothetical protein